MPLVQVSATSMKDDVLLAHGRHRSVNFGRNVERGHAGSGVMDEWIQGGLQLTSLYYRLGLTELSKRCED